MAFARLGLPWDDAVVVSAHGRPLEEALGAIRIARKVAVLTSPDTPPEVIGRALKRTGASVDLLAVCSRLGFSDEEVVELGLDDLASGKFDPLSVVVVVGPGGLPIVGWDSKATLAWGLDQGAFRHRAGMVTKAEVRAVILGKLALPTAGVLWDIGAGSGSVGIECARLSPGLTVFAVEKNPEDAQRVVANASSLDAGVHVVEGTAPEALVRLPDPDRVFVGGGGLEVLDEVLARLRPGGRVVASFAALDRATGAAERLGSLVQIGLSRAAPLPDGSWRLSAENPVFIAWGPNLGALDTGQA
jgi:precorrin-6Y C5,15-methyltransferase (decarboxylating)